MRLVISGKHTSVTITSTSFVAHEAAEIHGLEEQSANRCKLECTSRTIEDARPASASLRSRDRPNTASPPRACSTTAPEGSASGADATSLPTERVGTSRNRADHSVPGAPANACSTPSTPSNKCKGEPHSAESRSPKLPPYAVALPSNHDLDLEVRKRVRCAARVTTPTRLAAASE